MIDEIRRLNGIRDYTVHPGQRLILPRVGIEIAEGGGQAVAAMLQRSSAERP